MDRIPVSFFRHRDAVHLCPSCLSKNDSIVSPSGSETGRVICATESATVLALAAISTGLFGCWALTVLQSDNSKDVITNIRKLFLITLLIWLSAI